MRTFSAALATALLLWAGTLLKAQLLQKSVLPGFSKADTAATTDADHTKKAALKKFFLQNLFTSLGRPAGQKFAANAKQETDSLQQIIFLRKKF